MISVNLIPRTKRERQHALRQRESWIRFLRFYSIVLAVGCALAMLPAHAAPPSLESSIARLDRRIESTTKALDDSKKQLTTLSRQLDLAHAIGDHPDWSILLAALARACTDEAMLDSLDLSIVKIDEKPPKPDPAKPNAKPAQREIVVLKLSGLCSSPAGCFQFAHALEQLDVFERVVVKDTRSQPLGTRPATRFEIEAVAPAAPVQIPSTGGAK